MSKYDDLFADTAPDDSVFAAKRALDPLTEPDAIYARDAQERDLATILNGPTRATCHRRSRSPGRPRWARS